MNISFFLVHFHLIAVYLFLSLVKASDFEDHHHHHHGHHHSRDLIGIKVFDSRSPVAAGWYANWHEGANPASGVVNISWAKFNQIAYSFITPTENCSQLSQPGDSLPEFVQQAHKNQVKALVAVGGWAGSIYFSSSVGSAENRTAFVKALTDFAKENDLDGFNFDWEYPTQTGIGCNVVNPQDTNNYCAFLQELRQHPDGEDLILTVATGLNPFSDESGAPSTNVSCFADVLDYITIMNYDIWGPWSSAVGPNAPLDDSCADTQNREGSAATAVTNWMKAGIPQNQIVLGVASYGHSFVVAKDDAYSPGTTELRPYPPFSSNAYPQGSSWDGNGPDACGHNEPYGGDYEFWSLIENGFLDSNGNFKDEIPSRFDSCSQTPYVYNATSQIMVSFDNPESFARKGKFIAGTGLAGFAMWELGGDCDDLLVDAIRSTVFSD